MGKRYKVKSGAIVKIVPEGSLEWYKKARYTMLGEVLEEKPVIVKKAVESKKVKKNVKKNTKKNASK